MSIETTAEDVLERLESEGDVPDSITLADIEERLELLLDHDVPLDEAETSVLKHFAGMAGFDRNDILQSGTTQDSSLGDINIGEINTAEVSVNIEGKVVELWDSDSDAVAQSGLIGDKTGQTALTVFDGGDHTELEEGEIYRITNTFTQLYQGNYNLKANEQTTIEHLPDAEDFEVGSEGVSLTGPIVAIQGQSGFIMRCSDEDCTRVLQDGSCSEHGGVDGEPDLRIKAVLDVDGTIYNVVFDEEMTTELTGIMLDEAKTMVEESDSPNPVVEKIERDLLGHYFEIGARPGNYYTVQSATKDVSYADEDQMDELREQAKDVISA